jgi:hypothetical protein
MKSLSTYVITALPVGLFFLFMALVHVSVIAQACLSKTEKIEGQVILQDCFDPGLFYYIPGDLQLAIQSDGSPNFQMVEMRYTGTKSLGDKETKRFLNFVKVTIQFMPLASDVVQRIKSKLGERGRAKLKPLPIRYFQTTLLAPLPGDESVLVGKSGSIAGGSGKSLWSKKVFTLKLNNQGAEILHRQISSGQLALSFGYAFFAEVIQGRYDQTELLGDTSLLNQIYDSYNLDSNTQQIDSTLITQIIKANAFSIDIDLNKWPDAVKQIDLNAKQLVAYPILETRCYDFKEQLRPELYKKLLQVKATGASGQDIELLVEYSRKYPEVTVQYLHFPFAVKIAEPFQFRIKEIDRDGLAQTFPWKSKSEWETPIDLSTPDSLIKMEETIVEIESSFEDFINDEMDRLAVTLEYTLNGQTKTRKVLFKDQQDFPIQEIPVLHDRHTLIYYRVTRVNKDGTEKTGEHLPVGNNYLFIKPEMQ